jgi:hypothetical protein
MEVTMKPAARVALFAAFAAAACGDPLANVVPPDEVVVCSDAAVALAPGGVATRSASGACRIAPSPNALYVLAYMDTRAIERSQTGPEGAAGPGAPYTVTIRDLLASGSAAAHAAAPAAGAAGWLASAATDPGTHAGSLAEPHRRVEPWTLGNRFVIADAESNRDRQARVFAVDGPQVFAVFEDTGIEPSAAYLARLDSAMVRFTGISVPMLRTTLALHPPVTSTATRQHLVIFDAPASGPERTTRYLVNDSVFTVVRMAFDPAESYVRLGARLTRALAPSYLALFLHETRMSGAPSSAGTSWAIEGVADLAAFEFLRRYSGRNLLGNVDWQAATLERDAAFFERAQPGTGNFGGEGRAAAGFLRHVMQLLTIMPSMHPDAAFAEVARGAAEGWHGIDDLGVRRLGLTVRMQRVLGPDWTPAAEVVQWAHSHAADDRTSHWRYQDRTFLRVWDLRAGQAGWHPDASLTGGGGGATVNRPYNSPGYTYIRDTGRGVAVDIRTGHPQVYWAIYRIN